MSKTIGEIRVRTDFNPSKNGAVDQIKQSSAKLINDIDALVLENKESTYEGEPADRQREFGRLKALAQTHLETAAMYAVKAATT